ncbi:hypothetical protein BJX96DRAFT_129066 [Aspergillus floccosus]
MGIGLHHYTSGKLLGKWPYDRVACSESLDICNDTNHTYNTILAWPIGSKHPRPGPSKSRERNELIHRYAKRMKVPVCATHKAVGIARLRIIRSSAKAMWVIRQHSHGRYHKGLTYGTWPHIKDPLASADRWHWKRISPSDMPLGLRASEADESLQTRYASHVKRCSGGLMKGEAE